jgi:hypothetical protein
LRSGNSRIGRSCLVAIVVVAAEAVWNLASATRSGART